MLGESTTTDQNTPKQLTINKLIGQEKIISSIEVILDPKSQNRIAILEIREPYNNPEIYKKINTFFYNKFKNNNSPFKTFFKRPKATEKQPRLELQPDCPLNDENDIKTKLEELTYPVQSRKGNNVKRKTNFHNLIKNASLITDVSISDRVVTLILDPTYDFVFKN